MKYLKLPLLLHLIICLFSCQEHQRKERELEYATNFSFLPYKNFANMGFQWQNEEQNYHILPSSSEDLQFLSTNISNDFMLDVMLPQTQDKGTYGLLIAKDSLGNTPIAAIQMHNGQVVFAPAMQTNLGNTLNVEAAYFRLERIGDILTAYYARAHEPFRPIARQRIDSSSTVYGGLFVKTNDVPLTFNNLRITHLTNSKNMKSRLETYHLETQQRKVILEKEFLFEAPNWHPDSNYLIVNSQGLLYAVHFDQPDWTLIPTGKLTKCNNDHGITPDGKMLIISNNDSVGSRIYLLPINGGDSAQLVTPQAPSYWHGIHPDGKTIAYVAKRNRKYFNIYTSDLNGEKEKRITFTVGQDDGPDYSQDSTLIYYNSTQSGAMKIWQMGTDGQQRKQLTFDNYQDWFPHPSPDGKKLLFLSYLPDISPMEHPANQQVMLRLLDLTQPNSAPKVLVHLLGGQGTINVPSWSADSQSFAFVSYSYE